MQQVVTLWYRPPEILMGCKTYALPVDMWAVGTILAEMATKRPLFPGDSEIDELYKIFRVLGTPTNETWPGVELLQDWNPDFPIWPSLRVGKFCGSLEEQGVDLVEQLTQLDPKCRLSAKEALQHEYIAGMDTGHA